MSTIPNWQLALIVGDTPQHSIGNTSIPLQHPARRFTFNLDVFKPQIAEWTLRCIVENGLRLDLPSDMPEMQPVEHAACRFPVVEFAEAFGFDVEILKKDARYVHPAFRTRPSPDGIDGITRIDDLDVVE